MPKLLRLTHPILRYNGIEAPMRADWSFSKTSWGELIKVKPAMLQQFLPDPSMTIAEFIATDPLVIEWQPPNREFSMDPSQFRTNSANPFAATVV